jgi:hypothetical protein
MQCNSPPQLFLFDKSEPIFGVIAEQYECVSNEVIYKLTSQNKANEQLVAVFSLRILIVSGITRLPVLEGEISHIEIPRTTPNLGVTIVGGIDTALVRTLFFFIHISPFHSRECTRNKKYDTTLTQLGETTLESPKRWR